MKKTRLLYIIFCFCISFFLKAQKITFSPQWSAQSQFAGYYVAKKLGYYKEVGLTVDITYPQISENPNSKLQNKSSDVVTMNLVQALFYRSKGYNIVNIMQLSHQGGLFVATHFPIRSLMSFKGKKLAVWKYIDDKLISQIKEKYGKDIEIIRFNYGVNLFLSGAVDAIIASSYDEIIQLRQCGFEIKDDNVVYLSSLGFNIPEDGVYVTEEYYNKNKETIRKFVNASIKGWLWTRNNRKEAVNITLSEMQKNRVPTNLFMQKNMLDTVLNLQNYDPSNKNPFILTEREFNNSKSLLFQYNNDGMRIKYSDFVKP